jgi:hypothetical protein
MAITATVQTSLGTKTNLYIDWFSLSADKPGGFRADFHGYATQALQQAAGPGNDDACQWSQLVTFVHDATQPVLPQAQAALIAALTAQGVTDATAV